MSWNVSPIRPGGASRPARAPSNPEIQKQNVANCGISPKSPAPPSVRMHGTQQNIASIPQRNSEYSPSSPPLPPSPSTMIESAVDEMGAAALRERLTNGRVWRAHRDHGA